MAKRNDEPNVADPLAITTEERLRTLVEASPDPIFMKDGQGRWLEVNRAGLELFQLEHVDYRGKSEEELAQYSPFYKEALLYCGVTDSSAWTAGGLSRNEERIPRPNGVIRTYDVLKIPLFHSNGSRKGLLVLGRDITERILAEEERDRLLEKEQAARAAAERAERQASFLARTSQILAETLDYRDTANRLAGACVPFAGDWCGVWTTREDMQLYLTALATSTPLREDLEKRALALHFDMRNCHQRTDKVGPGKPLLRTMLAEASRKERLATIGSTNDSDIDIVDALGLDSFIAVPLVVHGQHLGVLTLGRGSTSVPLSASELELAANLARHASLALVNARLYEQARDAIVARDDFLSIASHELRTPCTSLRLGIEVLLRHTRQESISRLSPAFLERMLMTTDRQSKHLLYLIDRLLDVSRFDSGQLDLNRDETDLSALAFESVSELREEAARAGSDVSVHVNGRVQGFWDRTRIAQVCTNLLTNAIKYGSGKPITLRIWADGEDAFLSVEDNGIGIPSEQQSRIFGRFERAVSHRHYGGLGLGLYICRQIVEAHGGTIALSSANGAGTIFTVKLPRGEKPNAT